MTPEIITYLTFGGLLVVALIFDLGLLSKKHSHITIRKALWQTIFWVSLALAFFAFVWIEFDRTIALEYLSAYLTEWSLSIDNIFCIYPHLFFFCRKGRPICTRTIDRYYDGHRVQGHFYYYRYCSGRKI